MKREEDGSGTSGVICLSLSPNRVCLLYTFHTYIIAIFRSFYLLDQPKNVTSLCKKKIKSNFGFFQDDPSTSVYRSSFLYFLIHEEKGDQQLDINSLKQVV